MAALDPSLALATCEAALRNVMEHCYAERFGPSWLVSITDASQRGRWKARAEAENNARSPKGVASVAQVGLSYADFSELVKIAKANWDALSDVLGEPMQALTLLDRFNDLRNTVAHNRPPVPFERDLLAGIAGQIRNQVTLFMTTRDNAGDFYPRIESVTDSFGRRIERFDEWDSTAGYSEGERIVVRPGDVVHFECVGIDPQGRQLEWGLNRWSGDLESPMVGESREAVAIGWYVADADVRELVQLSIAMRAVGAQYHRDGTFDQTASFRFTVRPPADASRRRRSMP